MNKNPEIADTEFINDSKINRVWGSEIHTKNVFGFAL